MRRHGLRSGCVAAILHLVLAGCGDGPGSGVLPRGEPEVEEILVIARPQHYAFQPAEVVVGAGGRIRFVHAGQVPESILFDLEGLDPAASEWIRQRGLDAGPLLTRPGDVYEIDFATAPEGAYPFRSAAHAEAGMRGVVRVEGPG
jgi:plastocyanin